MTPRRPRPLLVLPVLLLLGGVAGLAGCGDDPATATPASEPAATGAPEPPATAAPDPTTPPAPGDRLPDDLALDSGLDHADTSTDFALEGPGREVDGVPMTDFCDPDPTTWPGTLSDRLAVRETGPEYEQSREALLYPTVEAARTALDGLREVVEACPEVRYRPGKESREDRLHELLEPAGPDVLTVGVHYRGVLGSGIYQVRLVGRTLLAARDLGEGSVDGLPEGARRMTTALDELLVEIGDDLP